MRIILFFIVLLYLVPAQGQNFVTRDGEFMDTTFNLPPVCDSGLHNYFYNVRGKYPESSTSLLAEARAFLAKKHKTWQGSGYVTFRFTIDCEGHRLRKVQVIQTDGQYKSYHFDKIFVGDLYEFLKTLDKWKAFRLASGQSYSYISFIGFKIQNGKVVNILP